MAVGVRILYDEYIDVGAKIKEGPVIILGAVSPFLESITDCGIAAFAREIQAQTDKWEFVYWAYCEQARLLEDKYAQMSTENEFRSGMLLGTAGTAKLVTLAIALHERYPLLLECKREGWWISIERSKPMRC